MKFKIYELITRRLDHSELPSDGESRGNVLATKSFFFTGAIIIGCYGN